MQAVCGEPFLEKQADALLVIHNQNRAALEDLRHFPELCDAVHGGVHQRGRSQRLARRGQIDGEGRAALRQGLGFDGAVVLAGNGQADTQSQSRAAPRPLGGVKRVKELRERFGAYAYAVILDGDADTLPGVEQAHHHAPGFAHFLDGVFRVGHQVEKDLDELIRVAHHRGQRRIGMKLHGDIAAAERVLVELQGALDERAHRQEFFLRRGRP